MFRPGELLGNEYRILEVLSGGMGEVFICEFVEHPDSKTPQNRKRSDRLALKTFQRRFFFDQGTRLSFIREATTWVRLSGLPHILPCFGIQQIGDRPFLRMLAVERGRRGERSIADRLRQGPLDAGTALKFAFQLAIALRMAADRLEGLVHGDLKPANVLLVNGEAFLADFGLASAVTLGRADTRLESTWTHRAPELWGDEPHTPTVSSDVYAFGTLLFEMLAGRTPFAGQGYDRNAWEEAHRHRAAVLPVRFPADGLPARAMELAIACLAKKPEARPKTFREVLDRVNKVYEEHDPVEHVVLMMRVRTLSDTLKEIPGLREERIRSLIEIEEPRQALEELDAVPDSEYSVVLWLRRGTALSLLNRDEEALGCFERAERGGLSPENLVNCRVEYALSLKRLRRFDEALALYEELLTSVSEEQLPLVIINLATVYLEQKRGEQTVDLLEPFVHRTPDSAPGWANLGQAYVFVERFRDAERAYGRALAAAPQEGRVRTMLAALYMDHLGRMEEAWAALDAAFDSGYEGREWLVRMLACSILLDRRKTIKGLMHALKHNFKEDLAKAMLEEAQTMVKDLTKKYSNSSDDVEASPVEYGPQQAASAAEPSPSNGPPSSASDEPNRAAKARLPFLTFRFYGSLDFTLDFYESPANPAFIESFLIEWRRAMRDPRMSMGGASLRGSPFYFTQCPECGVHVLTNRDIGYHIKCMMCDTPWQTDPKQGHDLEAILARVNEEIGIREQPSGSIVCALWVQPSEEGDLSGTKAICEAAGFAQWKNDQLLSIYLLQHAVKSGASLTLPWGVWVLETRQKGPWAENATPPQVAAVVRRIQAVDRHARTFSTTLTPEQTMEMRDSVRDVEALTERECREAIQAGRARATDYRRLADALCNRGEMEEAERYARAAVAADEQAAETWESLGRVLFKREDFAGAREALERAIALNPSSELMLRMLSICFMNLGDPDRARQLHARAVSISGGEFQG